MTAVCIKPKERKHVAHTIHVLIVPSCVVFSRSTRTTHHGPLWVYTSRILTFFLLDFFFAFGLFFTFGFFKPFAGRTCLMFVVIPRCTTSTCVALCRALSCNPNTAAVAEIEYWPDLNNNDEKKNISGVGLR